LGRTELGVSGHQGVFWQSRLGPGEGVLFAPPRPAPPRVCWLGPYAVGHNGGGGERSQVGSELSHRYVGVPVLANETLYRVVPSGASHSRNARTW